MLRRASLILVSVVVLACTKDKPKEQPTPAGSAAEASGSAAAGGSAAADTAGSGAGSGSATADSGSAAGSGSAVADSGSAVADSGSAAGSGAAASDVKFDKLSHEDKIKFMKQKVMPAMKPLFQKFDSKEFGNFTCKTCHGKDPQKSKYEMPNPTLHPLDFDAIQAGKEDAKMIEFMSKVVKPEMAKLLDEPEMSDTEPKGFGCLHCHTMKKKK